MLTDKAWRTEAILRLFLSVVVCGVLGGVAIAVVKATRFELGEKRVPFMLLAAGAVMFAAGALAVLRKPWELERFTRSFAMLLVCIYLSLTLSAFASGMTARFNDGNDALLMSIRALSFQGATLWLVQRFLRDHEANWATGFGLGQRPGIAVVYGFLVASTFLPIGWLLQLGSFKVLTLLQQAQFLQQVPEIQPAVQALKENVQWSDRAVLGIVAIVLAPLAEETLFRGILYPAIKQAGRPRLALWITSLTFAAVHAHAPSFLSLLLLALSLTWIYEYTRNLLAPIAAHACFNAFNFISGIYGDAISESLQQLLNRP